MKGSLNLRLIISSSIVLAAFLGLAGIALEQAYKEGTEQALQERLKIHIYAILSSAELDRKGQIQMPEAFPEARFSSSGSGLLAVLFSQKGTLLWRSKSNVGENPLKHRQIETGDMKYPYLQSKDYPAGLYAIYYGFVWEDISGQEHHFTLAVAEDAVSMQSQLSGFQNTLWSWLGTVVVLLIFVQALILRWSLKPLRVIANDLKAIEQGKQECLEGDYPKEIKVLSVNINGLIKSDRSHLARYRNTLADLAHSLKTPLAILRGCNEEESISPQFKVTLSDQIERMDELVEYQLKKAAAKGRKTLSAPIPLRPIIEKIIRSLDKVYADKEIQWQLELSETVSLSVEEGDIFEVFGNLLDNACKWTQREIKVSTLEGREVSTDKVILMIVDDGPGIEESQIEEVMSRGVRMDEQVKGHGIGLAVVKELVHLSGGEIKGAASPTGGLMWQVSLPGKLK